jgi:ABC-2 type transport system ATP-binding protein
MSVRTSALPPEGAVAAEAVVLTRGLTKIYKPLLAARGVRALDHLDLSIRPGETFGVIGPNGSGKTTFLKLLLGLIFPTSGQAWLFGASVFDMGIKTRVGYLPEAPYFYDCFNAPELLGYYADLFGLDPGLRRRRIDELLGLVGMREQARRPLREYSRGMLQRIGLAQALINDPELIILDEPTSGLDPEGSYKMRLLIAELKARGKTILFCSHYLVEVEDLCDRVGILHRGKLIASGSIAELMGEVRRTFVTYRDLAPAAVRSIEEQGLAVPSVEERQAGPTPPDGAGLFTLQADSEQAEIEATNALLDAIRRHGGRILEVKRPRPKLEDLFIEALRRAEA